MQASRYPLIAILTVTGIACVKGEEPKAKPNATVATPSPASPPTPSPATDTAGDTSGTGTDAGKDAGTDTGTGTGTGTDDAGNGGALVITGQVALSGGGEAPDAVIAFPVNGGVFKREALAMAERAPIVTGQVTLEIPGGSSLTGGDTLGESHVVAVYTASDDRFAAGESINFVNLDTGSGTEAINIITSDLKDDALDFGTISDAGGELVGSKAAATDTFNTPASVIQELAATDDSLKKIRNTFMNTVVDSASGSVTQFIETTPGFTFSGPASKLLSADLAAAPSVKYGGFLMYFGAEHPEFKLAALCNTTTGKLRLNTPPGTTIRSGAKTMSVLTNDDMDPSQQTNASDPTRKSCFKNSTAANALGFGMFIDGAPAKPSGHERIGWNWSGTGSDGFDGPIPAGMWTMTFGTGDNPPVVAKFDLAAAYPLDAENHPIVYMPSVRATSNAATKVIEKIDITWYLWDRATSTFKRVEELSAFKAVVSQLNVGFFDMSRTGARAEQGSGVPFPASGSIFTASKTAAVSNNGWTHDWRLGSRFYAGQDDADGGNGTQPTAETVSIAYKMYGNSYSFAFNLSKCYCGPNGPNFKVLASNTQLDLSDDFPANTFASLDECHAALDTKIGADGAICR